LKQDACEGCESKKVEIPGKARMYARVRNRIKKREGKAPQTMKAKGETKLIEANARKSRGDGEMSPFDLGCEMTEAAHAEASEECCSADFATHSL
jgi:hypothetical protein